MDVHWLEQGEADERAGDDWLSEREAAHLNSLRFAKRRTDWKLGRWTAKLAVAAYLDLSQEPQALSNIELRAAPTGVPEVFIANRPAEVTISLSHRASTAVCAIARAGIALGCDLEIIEPRSDGFVADYFTTEEQGLIMRCGAADRSRILAILWSGKESALKALHTGLRDDTRNVSVSPVDPATGGDQDRDTLIQKSSQSLGPSIATNWRPLIVTHARGQLFHGWWQQMGSLVRTLVAAPPPAPPIRLHLSSSFSRSTSRLSS